MSCRLVPANFTTSLSTSARVTFCTRKLLACPPARSISKTSASEPGTRTSFSFSLGTETYRVLAGLASEGVKVIPLTARSAFMACTVFSLYIARRFSGTDTVLAAGDNF